MAPLVRTGGSRHTGLAAPPHRNIQQKQLSEKTGIYQSDISKLERGNANPSILTLKRLADAMDMTLKIEFVPKK